jgi:hypothetical protein
VKPLSLSIAVVLSLSITLDLAEAFRIDSARVQSETKVDFTRPQSLPKPVPKWLKIVDQDANELPREVMKMAKWCGATGIPLRQSASEVLKPQADLITGSRHRRVQASGAMGDR